MVSKRIEEISITLTRLANPGVTPKELLEATRRKHPQASRKEIARAAFYALIANADTDVDKANRLHDFAVAARPVMERE